MCPLSAHRLGTDPQQDRRAGVNTSEPDFRSRLPRSYNYNWSTMISCFTAADKRHAPAKHIRQNTAHSSTHPIANDITADRNQIMEFFLWHFIFHDDYFAYDDNLIFSKQNDPFFDRRQTKKRKQQDQCCNNNVVLSSFLPPYTSTTMRLRCFILLFRIDHAMFLDR